MKDIIKVLDRIIVEKTKNPYLRFILKKNIREEKIKAFKTLSVELYLHNPGHNRRIITVQSTVNSSHFTDDSDMWNTINEQFIYEVFKLLLSNDLNSIIDEYTME